MMNYLGQGRAQSLQYEQRRAESIQVTQIDFIYKTASRRHPATQENLSPETKTTLW